MANQMYYEWLPDMEVLDEYMFQRHGKICKDNLDHYIMSLYMAGSSVNSASHFTGVSKSRVETAWNKPRIDKDELDELYINILKIGIDPVFYVGERPSDKAPWYYNDPDSKREIAKITKLRGMSRQTSTALNGKSLTHKDIAVILHDRDWRAWDEGGRLGEEPLPVTAEAIRIAEEHAVSIMRTKLGPMVASLRESDMIS